jgi:site-specific DNA-methyltransferase (cytosine-N4-specific)
LSSQKSLLSPFTLPPSSKIDAGSYSSANTLTEWIDEWSFKSSNTAVYTHKIHRYPAMFIPQLVRKIIEVYSEKGDTILDIFNGSGSTLVETKLTSRNGIGIELNPLAILISKVKTTPIDFDIAEIAFKKIEDKFFSDDETLELINFDHIDYWFSPNVIRHISVIIKTIEEFTDKDVRDFLKICLSEIVREVSWCIHSGFKMHRDKIKLSKDYGKNEFFTKFSRTVDKNIRALKSFTEDADQTVSAKLIFANSTELQNLIEKSSVDLILTSPPYGDSSTTVAYGQFSRLSSQVLGLETLGEVSIANLDNDLLGGRPNKINAYKEVIDRSLTIANVVELYNYRIDKSQDKVEKKKLELRLMDVLAFYKDLDDTLRNGAYYLKENRHFILVTGSRVVKLVKLHTDLIIAELAEKYGLTLSAIFYRNIENKRMPSKVSATNIVGEKAPTMTRESIIVLKKTG